MTRWLHAWVHSHTDTRFFQRMAQYTGGFLAMYLLGFYFLFAVANTALFSTRTLPQWTEDARHLWIDFEKNWPENVSVSLQDNQLSLAGADELVLPLPQHIASRYHLPSYAVLFSEEVQVATASATPAAIIATPHFASVWRPDGTYREEPWARLDLGNFTFEKSTFSQQANAFEESIGFLRTLSITTSFVLSWIGILAARLLALVLYAWIGQTILWLSGSRSSYKNVWKIGLFLLPIAEEILLLIKLLYPLNGVFGFWFIWFALLIAVAFTNQKQLGTTGTVK